MSRAIAIIEVRTRGRRYYVETTEKSCAFVHLVEIGGLDNEPLMVRKHTLAAFLIEQLDGRPARDLRILSECPDDDDPEEDGEPKPKDRRSVRAMTRRRRVEA